MSQPASTPLPPLVPAAVLKTRIPGLSDADAEQQAHAASALVRRRCGWHIAPVLTGHLLVVDSPGGQTLQIPSLRVLALTGVTERTVLVPDADVEWSTAGMLFRESGWRRGFRSVQVTIDHGYDDVPDLRELLVTVVARALATSGTAGLVREQTGPFSVEFAPPGTALADHEGDVLAPFTLA